MTVRNSDKQNKRLSHKQVDYTLPHTRLPYTETLLFVGKVTVTPKRC